MDWQLALAGAAAVPLLGYLIYSLLYPERF